MEGQVIVDVLLSLSNLKVLPFRYTDQINVVVNYSIMYSILLALRVVFDENKCMKSV